MKKIPLGKPWHDECEIERIKEVLDSGCWGGTCPVVEEFEKKFAKTVGTKYAIATSSCATGLHTALLSVGIGEGDEVIIPAFTHPATGFAVAQCQSKPVLADVSLDTYTINPEKIWKMITEKTKAIAPIYAFGMPSDMSEITKIAYKHDLKMIWDTATGLGAKYKSKNAGTFSDCECFSLFPTKIISTGEGGMITTDEEEIAAKVHALVNFGKGTSSIGYNYRLSAVQAAIGLCQLEKLSKILKSRKYLVEYYIKYIQEEVSNLYWLHPQIEPKDAESSWQRFVCRIDNNSRDELMGYLKKNGIGCTFGTNSLASHPYFKTNDCLIANYLYYNTIALPLYYNMPTEDVDYVIEKLIGFKSKK